MKLILPFSFDDFPEDVQIRILSFLNPSELDLFARTSTRFPALCSDDERLWFLKCSRRWGSQTQIQNWGGRKISYRHLYHFLEKQENLIGFWYLTYCSKTSSALSPPLLACFEWGSFYITGYRISPSKCGGYGMTKKPFLWITATSNGKWLNYLDTDGSVPLTEKDLLKQDSEKLRGGLVLADIQLDTYKYCKLSVRENPQFSEFTNRLSTWNGREECESVYRSPPDGLMTQIFKTLASKLSVTGDATSKRERRDERRREREKWRRMRRWDGQHFRKIMECSPTPSRPLQGLWKGIFLDGSLNFYLVYYCKDLVEIISENVGSSSTDEYYSNFGFRAVSTAFITSPYSPEEESIYNSRDHVRPPAQANQSGRVRATSSDDHDVSRIFCMNSSYDNLYLTRDFVYADGRIWLYTNGTFGFGFLRDDFIVDLKPVIENGRLLDFMVQESGEMIG